MTATMHLINYSGGNRCRRWATMARMTINELRRVRLQPEEWPKGLADTFHTFQLNTWGDLETFNAKQLLRVKGLGRSAFNHLMSALQARGLGFNDGPLPTSTADVKRAPQEGPGVYFIKCDRFVKVGFATDVRARFRELACAMPMQPELLCVIRAGTPIGARHIERAVHERYRQHRVRGEWFHAEALEDIIRPLRCGEPVKLW